MPNNSKKSKIFTYEVKIKLKGKQKFLPNEELFKKLNELSNRNYDRSCNDKSRLRKVSDVLVSFDRENKNYDKLNEVTYNYIDFFVGKEINENIHYRDQSGNEGNYTLPDGMNFCFKTHGRFIFKKEDDSWKCVLIYEKKYEGIGIKAFEIYLKLIFPENTIIFNQIYRKEDFQKRINSIDGLYRIYCKNQQVSLEEYKDSTEGEIMKANDKNKPFLVAKMEIDTKDLSGRTPFEKIKAYFYNMTKNKVEFNEENMKQLIKMSNSTFYGKRIDESKPRSINLFSDIYLFDISVELDKNRLILSKKFFEALNSNTSGIIPELFSLVD